MARRNPDLPRPSTYRISKVGLLRELVAVDASKVSTRRVLRLESDFRERISSHIESLPTESSTFQAYKTNPFVLMMYAKQNGLRYVSEIERGMAGSKAFSSMETSAGRMIQDIVMPVYGWNNVSSSMQSPGSVIDATRMDGLTLRMATIKSGPRTLNDEMSKDIAEDIVNHSDQWAEEANVDHIAFTYGVLYGTKKQSNKNDWHILRNIVDSLPNKLLRGHPAGKWTCSYKERGLRVDVSVLIGDEWWGYIGGKLARMELMCALVRACVAPASMRSAVPKYSISDLGHIVSTENVPATFNVGVLQQSQYEWMFLLARHFCDEITE